MTIATKATIKPNIAKMIDTMPNRGSQDTMKEPMPKYNDDFAKIEVINIKYDEVGYTASMIIINKHGDDNINLKRIADVIIADKLTPLAKLNLHHACNLS
jgi:hypothetical protein